MPGNYGVPPVYACIALTRRYRYFGGSLQLVPMDGWGKCSFSVTSGVPRTGYPWFLGTDVYVRLPKLVSLLLLPSQVVCNRALKGTNLEGIEV